MKYLRWFLSKIRPWSFALTVAMLANVLKAVCSIAFVVVCKRLVDIAVSVFSSDGDLASGKQSLILFSCILVGISLLRILLNAYVSYSQSRIEVSLKNNLRRELFESLLNQSISSSSHRHSGDIVNRLQEDVRAVSSAFASIVPVLLGTLIQFLAAFIYLCYLQWKLALLMLVLLPVGILLGKFITSRVRNLTHDIRKKDSRVMSHLQESLQHITLLQTLEYSDESVNSLGQMQGGLYDSEMRRMKFSLVSRIFLSLTFSVAYAIAFLWGVFGISTGAVTYGMMTAFLQLLAQIQRPLLDMSGQLPALIHATASIDRLMEIENLPKEESVSPVMMEGIAGVRVEHLFFRYPESERDIYSDFSYDFPPGSRTAILGPTGIGKSTLIKLLLALEKPSKGTVTLYSFPPEAGAPHKENVSADTRCNLVYVPQGNSLFSGTIRENLMMGNPKATLNQMIDALHIAAADFVFDLPQGLDSQCFEAGGGLSEGQAQRIAVARALLRPGSILLFDEFSSALDSETEHLLMQRLNSAMNGRTMIFITHREEIVEYCDNVLRLGKEN